MRARRIALNQIRPSAGLHIAFFVMRNSAASRFVKQAQEIVKTFFQNNSIVFTPGDDSTHLFIQYHNFLLRVIAPYPRQVLESKELLSVKLEKSYQDHYNLIKARIEQGLPVYHWQSKKLLHADKKDWLFAGWGVQHLHLSPPPKQGDLMAPRSDYLLFLLIRDQVSYHIAILPHAESHKWARKSFLEILYFNWPEVMEIHRQIEVYPTTEPEPDDKTREELHKAGINTVIDIDGKVFASPNLGFNPNGYNVNSLHYASNLQMRLIALESHTETNPNYYRDQIISASLEVTEPLQFEVTAITPDIVITETQSGFEFSSPS